MDSINPHQKMLKGFTFTVHNWMVQTNQKFDQKTKKTNQKMTCQLLIHAALIFQFFQFNQHFPFVPFSLFLLIFYAIVLFILLSSQLMTRLIVFLK